VRYSKSVDVRVVLHVTDVQHRPKATLTLTIAVCLGLYFNDLIGEHGS
jgi:hypothetical protein